MTVKGLKDYIIGQGASQMQLQLEWDGIWTVNKKVIDPVAPRYWAVAEDKLCVRVFSSSQADVSVTVDVKGRDKEEVEVLDKPLHKKNPEIGNKKQVYSSNLIVEQEDAASFGDNEEARCFERHRHAVTR